MGGQFGWTLHYIQRCCSQVYVHQRIDQTMAIDSKVTIEKQGSVNKKDILAVSRLQYWILICNQMPLSYDCCMFFSSTMGTLSLWNKTTEKIREKNWKTGEKQNIEHDKEIKVLHQPLNSSKFLSLIELPIGCTGPTNVIHGSSTSQLAGPANVLVPETKRHIQRPCGVSIPLP